MFGGGVTPPVILNVLLGLRLMSEELVAGGEITVDGGESIVFPGEALIKNLFINSLIKLLIYIEF